MQARRNSMMRRVARRYARVPGQHGDAAPPAFFPVAINPGWWGQPFAKVKDAKYHLIFAYVFCFPIVFYWTFDVTLGQRTRIAQVGKRAMASNFLFRQLDLDDPDHAIKYEHLQQEVAENKLDVRWGGTNFLASYLWEPGDPEPDIRRKEAPAHHH
ncbi:putative mitochondrial hypothetical protein [Leptomonas pyrrhocoris]|uniref:Uncharacterized protein n=1 Tax=Leptomonas pyrrhocoris TaxID=157538 RepID=A0A0N0DVX6_LEPPY|nr:putative mitochondrial hypothetical protein [Leptomonas pyrrhocoris]XP_015659431.1 putative mitochondrial hypothetical protein [Leptomonas pyrrhocoris]KPA80991.1 putative mitochondrial hypothetical protein [Leptomonas pyrrhocoris]KPA80992.1 putative mitochondrial hypothetical protein [Leptomonas pyrrhocoris]|eukprot:XP_015659430.1 putative mitochondrial hypothetical protein [Leptomonas pyrrhocoris]